VSSFDDTVALLRETGLFSASLQESRRETWRLGTVEIVLDEWPWLKPYIEIEGESEADIRTVAEKLGFEWSAAVFGSVMSAYRVQYPFLKKGDGRTLETLPEVRFDMLLPEIFKP
jgi:adenylate cyclase class 2